MSSCPFDPGLLPRDSLLLREAIRHAPKCELHIHVEGALEPERAFELAARNGVVLPYASIDALRSAYTFDSLQSFLDVYYSLAPVLVTEADFRDLALAYLRRAASDGIVHAEVFFDPQSHTCRGIDIGAVIRGLAAARRQAASELSISVDYIMCFLRHQDEEQALATLEAARPYLRASAAAPDTAGSRLLRLRDSDFGIVGIGLDSSEKGNPPEKFARAFAAARAAGLRPVAHAGEEGPPAYIWSALDTLKVERVDHGVAAVQDEVLLERLAHENTPLTVCPLSNIKLAVFPHMSCHPLLRLLEAGVKACVNSDDPAFFGGYLLDNFHALLEGLPGMHAGHTWRLLHNSIEASFLPEEKKAAYASRIDAVFCDAADRARSGSSAEASTAPTSSLSSAEDAPHGSIAASAASSGSGSV